MIKEDAQCQLQQVAAFKKADPVPYTGSPVKRGWGLCRLQRWGMGEVALLLSVMRRQGQGSNVLLTPHLSVPTR